MSVDASPERAASGLAALLQRAGGVVARRDGAPVVVNYGSSAGELAVCVSAAGVADCSELTKLELAAPSASLETVMTRVAGGTVAPGGALFAGGAWWCGVWPGRVVVLCDPRTGARLHALLREPFAQQRGLRVSDRTADWSALAVVGRRTREVLQALGVYGPGGDPRQASPLTPGAAGEAPALWLLESDHRALAIVSRDLADQAWQAIERAGRPYGICCVGQDAVARYALLERQPLCPSLLGAP